MFNVLNLLKCDHNGAKNYYMWYILFIVTLKILPNYFLFSVEHTYQYFCLFVRNTCELIAVGLTKLEYNFLLFLISL